jgi:hypothetical protein
MFVLALALLAAPAALPTAEPQRTHAKRSARRTVRTRVRTVRLTPLPRADRNAKYRVADAGDAAIDFKTRIVTRGAFQNCGVTGMPVCPSKGMPIIHSETR